MSKVPYLHFVKVVPGGSHRYFLKSKLSINLVKPIQMYYAVSDVVLQQEAHVKLLLTLLEFYKLWKKISLPAHSCPQGRESHCNNARHQTCHESDNQNREAISGVPEHT